MTPGEQRANIQTRTRAGSPGGKGPAPRPDLCESGEQPGRGGREHLKALSHPLISGGLDPPGGALAAE